MSEYRLGLANIANLPFLERLYIRYREDPRAVDVSWQYFFEGWEWGGALVSGAEGNGDQKLRVEKLIDAYRTYGHWIGKYNPLSLVANGDMPEELQLEHLGFLSTDLEKLFPTCGILPIREAPLHVLVDALERIYCGNIGVEYIGVGSPQMQGWIAEQLELPSTDLCTSEEQKRILEDLHRAELFETFLHTKYVGQKRFSLEGAETLIPMLQEIVRDAAGQGVTETVLGMAHRGRLNVLANVLGKPYAHIFYEFEDHDAPDHAEGTGDVKYHRGCVATIQVEPGKEMTVRLAANPSHLEMVDSVVEGQAYALQQHATLGQVLPILIHGDAAVAGQGIVYETIQMGRLRGYGTGGTIHIVINNQIGFTAVPEDCRSTRYCTDIAKSFSAPVFHVNAEDPEGCVRVARLGLTLRQKFQCDVFIDLVCYRKYGHNEGDEPLFTQPLQYKMIKAKQTILDMYVERLVARGVLLRQDGEMRAIQWKQELQMAMDAAHSLTLESSSLRAQEPIEEPDTAVSVAQLNGWAEKMAQPPEGFVVHPKVLRIFQARVQMFAVDRPVFDWAAAETFAYASLLDGGIHVRISGQDSRRGTFSHRHAMWVDQLTGAHYSPLSHLRAGQATFAIYNSLLSEYAVLGFEFGYSLIEQNALVIWEAQYGDFANGAQVVIDQCIAAAEQKWALCSSLTLLLPHGYEGGGPEHSSARIERYLQLASQDNLRIVHPTTPAQFFHLLRRQVLHRLKKPLIVFTPKGLLRHPMVLSPLTEFTHGKFHTVLDDPSRPKGAEKVLICSGKVYYDLVTEREKRGMQTRVAIIRVEQLYPWDRANITSMLSQYRSCKKVVWAQEEHANMGAWGYVAPLLQEVVGCQIPCVYAGRKGSASTAAGSYALHQQQYESFMEDVFAL